MVLLLANELCEVVLVFTCMFYHSDYYRILVIAYDYEYSQHHASFHVYVCFGSESGTPTPNPVQPPPPPPPPTHTHTHTNNRTNEEDLWITTREKMKKRRKQGREIKKGKKRWSHRSACNWGSIIKFYKATTTTKRSNSSTTTTT